MNIDQHHVYILAITFSKLPSTDQTTVYKVGYSTNVHKRVKSLSSLEKPSSTVRGMGITIHNITILSTATSQSKELALTLEKSLHRKYKIHKYRGHPILANANSELYTADISRFELGDSSSLFTEYNGS